jgi:hypothetical protein
MTTELTPTGSLSAGAAVAPAEHPTDRWTVYYHRHDDKKWDYESYTVVATFKTVEQCWAIMNSLGDEVIAQCMIFIMRGVYRNNDKSDGGGIPPLYEHYRNCRGGSYSMRINSKYAADDFKRCVAAIVGETFAPARDRILGISISPKTSYVIIKVWNEKTSERNESALSYHIPPEHLTDGLQYKAHMDKPV